MDKYFSCFQINFFKKIKNKFNKKYDNIPQNDIEMMSLSNNEKKEIILNKIKDIIKNDKFSIFKEKNEFIDNIIKNFFIQINCQSYIAQDVIKLICKKCGNNCYLYQYKCKLCEEKYGENFSYFDYECRRYYCRENQYFTDIKHQYHYHPKFIEHITECLLENNSNIEILYKFLL
jgi:hypothetical protein